MAYIRRKPGHLAQIEPGHAFANTQITIEAKLPSNSSSETTPVPTHESVTVSVSWGYELHTITLAAEDWVKVISGDDLKLHGPGYYYEDEFFQDYWHFSGGLDGSVEVTYGDDGAQGFIGQLMDADIQIVSGGS
jgi:hypothetical protein